MASRTTEAAGEMVSRTTASLAGTQDAAKPTTAVSA
jgi:hypothetical protein